MKKEWMYETSTEKGTTKIRKENQQKNQSV